MLLLVVAVLLSNNGFQNLSTGLGAKPKEAVEFSEGFNDSAAKDSRGGEVGFVPQPTKSSGFEIMKEEDKWEDAPSATSSIQPGVALSPYPPYSLIDVTGLESGAIALDPSTIPIDPETGKQYVNEEGFPDYTKAKGFRVP